MIGIAVPYKIREVLYFGSNPQLGTGGKSAKVKNWPTLPCPADSPVKTLPNQPNRIRETSGITIQHISSFPLKSADRDVDL